MDLAKAGGKVLIGGVLVLAAVDGALLAILAAAGVGVWASKSWHKTLQGSTDLIHKDTRKKIAAYAAATHYQCEDDPATYTEFTAAEIKVRENEAKVLFTQLEKRQAVDSQGNSDLAKLIGIGTFVIPPLGVAYILGRKRLVAKAPKVIQTIEEKVQFSPVKKRTTKKLAAKKPAAKKPAAKKPAAKKPAAKKPKA